MKLLLPLLLLLSASPSLAQQYRNYEVQPNGYGGYTGTYGNRNFDIGTRDDNQGHIGGRRPNVLTERPSTRRGSVGATQGNCLVDGNGNAFCR